VVRATNAREISPVVLDKMSSLNVTGQEMQQLGQLREFGFAQGIKFHFLKFSRYKILQAIKTCSNLIEQVKRDENRLKISKQRRSSVDSAADCANGFHEQLGALQSE
jgi:hypothetical protein